MSNNQRDCFYVAEDFCLKIKEGTLKLSGMSLRDVSKE